MAEDGVAAFRQRDLRGARFEVCDLRDARFRNVALVGARIVGAELNDVVLDGLIDGLVVNGVEVAPLVEAELNRRDPDRLLVHPHTADEFRAAWAMVCRRWEQAVDRARRLPPDALHQRVDDEWSFIETLRHLVFCIDAWVSRAVLGDPRPYHPLGLTHAESDDDPDCPHDAEARPSLDEMLAVRAGRQQIMSELLAGLTDEQLDGVTTPVDAPGYPPANAYPVRRCLGAVIAEEWDHRVFAERDLAELEAQTSASARSSSGG